MDSAMLETILLGAVPVVLAITLHEAAHGYVARMFGDHTAWMLGRVTLNPLKHIDPMGTVLIPAVLLLIGAPFVFGWAKPVPVNFGNLRNPKADMFWVAAAGPGSNFLQALLWAIVFKLVVAGAVPSPALAKMAEIGLIANLALMALNLLPVPPLDGGRIAVSLLPHRAAAALSRVEPYGLFVVVALLATGILGRLMQPLMVGAERLIAALISL
jgi:Zn-dependent protease